MQSQFASVLVEYKTIPKEKTGKSIGIDIGIKTFLTLSDSNTIENPQYFRENQTKLAKAQKHLSRKLKGSKRRQKARLKVARIHNTIVNKRKDFIHKTTTQLVIAIEDLHIMGMIKNYKLAKSITDASFVKFYNVLSYKADWYGKEIIKVDRWFASSKTCSCCGWKNECWNYRIEYLNVKSVN
jgi:putative transposase